MPPTGAAGQGAQRSQAPSTAWRARTWMSTLLPRRPSRPRRTMMRRRRTARRTPRNAARATGAVACAGPPRRRQHTTRARRPRKVHNRNRLRRRRNTQLLEVVGAVRGGQHRGDRHPEKRPRAAQQPAQKLRAPRAYLTLQSHPLASGAPWREEAYEVAWRNATCCRPRPRVMKQRNWCRQRYDPCGEPAEVHVAQAKHISSISNSTPHSLEIAR